MAGEKTIYLEHPKSGHIYMSLGPFSGDVINLRTGKERYFRTKEFMKLKRLSLIDSASLDININVPAFYRSWHAQQQLAQSSPSRTPEQSAEDKEYVSHALDYIYDGKGPGRPIFPTGREHISSQPSRISEHFGTNLALEQAAATGDGFPPAQSPPSRTPSRQPYHEGSGAFVDNDMNG